jgi:hypothetical protein
MARQWWIVLNGVVLKRCRSELKAVEYIQEFVARHPDCSGEIATLELTMLVKLPLST